jgi:hypothetical protein
MNALVGRHAPEDDIAVLALRRYRIDKATSRTPRHRSRIQGPKLVAPSPEVRANFETAAGARGGVESRPALRGWRVEHVWDASQTVGRPLPEPPRPQLLHGEPPKGLFDAVGRLVEGKGFGQARPRLLSRARQRGSTGQRYDTASVS